MNQLSAFRPLSQTTPLAEGKRPVELAEVIGGVTLERLSRGRVGAGSLFAAPAMDETDQWLIVGILVISILLVYTLISGPILTSY